MPTTINYTILDEEKKKKAQDNNKDNASYANQLNNDNANYVPLTANVEQKNTEPTYRALSATKDIATNTPTQSAVSSPKARDYTNWSKYDQALPEEAQSVVEQAKSEYATAKANGDQNAMTSAYNKAQSARAKYGSYIDNVGDGSGYSYFGEDTWTAADRNLPDEAKMEISKAKQGFATATSDADRQYWNTYAENVRKKYGYTAGTSGNQYNELGILDSGYTNKDPYISQYEQQIQQLLSDINGSKFSYDYVTDPAYQSYVDAYTRAGNSAAETGLAQSASATGGIASSYAAAVANQAQQAYAKKTSDMIPTLQQQAYDRYNTELTNKLNILNQYNTLENQNYSKYADNRDFDFNTWLQNFTNAYKKYYDERALAESQTERDWQSGENELDRELQKYLASLS